MLAALPLVRLCHRREHIREALFGLVRFIGALHPRLLWQFDGKAVCKRTFFRIAL
jgi:hypothetical protein